jgi:transposase-like protein
MVWSPLTSGDEDRTGRWACLNWGDATFLSSHADRSASLLRAAQRELATRAPSTGANPQHRRACHQQTQPDIEAEHWQHLKTSNPIESTFSTVRLRTRVTKGPGSKAAGLAMAFKLLASAQERWRAVNGRTWSRWCAPAPASTRG